MVIAGYAAAVLYLSVIPVDDELPVDHLDKAVHLGEYLLLAWLLVQAVRAHQLRQRDYLALAWIFATSYGLLLEVLQMALPWRSGELADAAINAVGAAIGVWLGERFPRSSRA